MRTLSQKLEGAKRYVIHPDYKIGLKMLDEFIEDAKKLEAQVKNLTLHSVSKRFEIDFDGNVLAGIEITNNEPKVYGAMNGWGNGISPDKCKITEKTD